MDWYEVEEDERLVDGRMSTIDVLPNRACQHLRVLLEQPTGTTRYAVPLEISDVYGLESRAAEFESSTAIEQQESRSSFVELSLCSRPDHFNTMTQCVSQILRMILFSIWRPQQVFQT